MRTISADKQAVIDVPTRTEFLRVEVKDSGGTWRNLSTYAFLFDPQISASWSENVDDPHATAEVVLRREQEALSLSPYMQNSALNRAFDPTNPYAPLLAVNREFRISVAVAPMDKPVVSGDFEIFFHGRIDSMDVASTDNISFQGRDLGGKLANTFIEEERVYGLAAVAGNPVTLRIWAPSTVYALNTYVLPSEAKRDVAGAKNFYKVTTGGTSAATEPTWPTGGAVVNGTATFTLQGTTSADVGFPVEKVIQNILDDWSTGVTLYVPAAVSFDVSQYLQSRVSVLEAIRALALLFGGDVRYKWRSGTAAFELTLFEPDRAKVGVDYTFSSSDYEGIGSLKSEISGVRNVWQGVYSDASDKDPSGRPKRKTVVVQDAVVSIPKYGRLWAEIAEDESSMIDSTSEMTRMLNAALSDTKEPKVEQEIQLAFGFPWVEVNDLLRFSANGRHYSTDQDLAVFSLQHEVQGGTMRTTVSTRGQPSAGFDRWHESSTLIAKDGSGKLALFTAAKGAVLVASTSLGGVTLKVQSDTERYSKGEAYEYHLSDVSVFTPDLTTLRGVGQHKLMEITDLVPGKTYYSKIVPVDTDDKGHRNRAHPSESQAAVAGYANPIHTNPSGKYGTPLNGDFEVYTQGTAVPPDQWTAITGAWATQFEQYTLDAISNGSCLRLKPVGSVGQLASAPFAMLAGKLHSYSFWYKVRATAAGVHDSFTIGLEQYDAAGSLLGTGTQTIAPAATTGWVQVCVDTDSLAGTRAGRIVITKDSSATLDVLIDDVRVVEAMVQPAVGAVFFTGGWGNFGGGYYAASYWRDMFGYVHLRGLVSGGAIGSSIFTLPAGWRPAANVYRITVSNNTVGVVDIRSGGLVIPQVGSNVHFSLDGIYFRTDM